MTEKIGLQSVFDTKDFQKGLSIYLKGLKEADQATSKTSDSAGQAGSSVGGMGAALGGATGGLSLLGAAALGAAAAIGVALVNALKDAVVGVVELGKESTITASRVDELNLIAQVLGQRAGYTSQAVEEEVQSVKDFGIQADVAAKTVAQFIRYNLDLADASKIARVAQDAATISGANSSESLDRVLYGIITYNKRVLRTAGLNTNLAKGFEIYAASLGKTKEDLTESERVQAALNSTLLEGVKIQGLYEATLATPSKLLRTYARDVFDLKDALGQPFQEAFLTIIQGARTLTQALTAAVSAPKEIENELGEMVTTGGELYDIFIKLGAAASLFADGLIWLGTAIKDWVIGAFSGLETTADNAFEWGINIITQLADGIITAALGVLTWAMNQITALLTYWLSSSSPPRVAPDLPKWGANAMTEFLKGFTQADFTALKTIQAPLQRALGILVQTGKIGKQAGASFLVGFSTELAKVLSGGKLDPKLFDRLAKSVGPFGAEIADLAKKVLNLAYAEEELEKARRKEDESTKAVVAGIDEYNRLLRAGATEEALDTQLEYINAQEAQRQAAKDQRSETEQQLDTLREAVSLQQQLVEQLLSLSSAQVSADLAAAAAAGKGIGGALGAGIEAGVEGGLAGAFEGFTDKINVAVQEMKTKLLEAFTPLTEKWTKEWQPMFAELEHQWNIFEATVADIWYSLFGDRGLVTVLINSLDFTGLQEALSGLGESFGTLVDSFGTLIGLDTSGTEGFIEKLKAWTEKPEVIAGFQSAIDLLTKAFEELALALEWVAGLAPNLGGILADPLGIGGFRKQLEEDIIAQGEDTEGLLGPWKIGVEAELDLNLQELETELDTFAGIMFPTANITGEGSLWGRALEEIQALVDPASNLSGLMDDAASNQVEFQDALNVTTAERLAALEEKLTTDIPPAFEESERASGGWMSHLSGVVGEGIVTFLGGAMTDLETSFGSDGDLQTNMINLQSGTMTDLTTAFSSAGNLWTNIMSFKDTLLENLVTGIDSVSSAIGTLILRLIELQNKLDTMDLSKLDAVTESSPAPMAVGLEQVQKALAKVTSKLPKLSVDFSLPDDVESMQDMFSTFTDQMPSLSADFAMPDFEIPTSFTNMITALSDTIDNFNNLSLPQMPSLSADLAMPDFEIPASFTNMLSAFSDAISNMSLPQMEGAASPINMMPSPIMAGVPISAGAQTQNISLNFSAVINSDMDMTTFEDRVSRIVISLLT